MHRETPGIKLNYAQTRKQFSLAMGTEIPVDVLQAVYKCHNTTHKFLAVIDRDFADRLNFDVCNYILHKVQAAGSHYLTVLSTDTQEPQRNRKVKRSLLAFDFET